MGLGSAQPLNILVIDSSRPLNFALNIGKLEHIADYCPIKNVSELVNILLLKCGTSSNHRVIKRLTIIGHGNPKGVFIGEDWVDDTTLSNFSNDLAKLVPFFSRAGDAVVTLFACMTGRNEKLLGLLSSLLGGVTVRAMTASQNAFIPSEQGSVTQCIYSQCSNSGRLVWDKTNEDPP